MNLYERRVRRGAAYLDEAHPDWLDKLDVGTLDIDSARRCVLAQVASPLGFLNRYDFHRTNEARDHGSMWMLNRGFMVPGVGNLVTSVVLHPRGGRGTEVFKRRQARLEQAWRTYVVDRRIANIREREENHR